MKNAFKLGLACTLLCTSAIYGEESAEDKKPYGKFERDFKKLDSNNDKKVSLEEYLAKANNEKKKAKMEEHFKSLDKDHDGYLTSEEMSMSLPGAKSKKKKKEE